MITEEQTQKLFDFTRAHYVSYYDVQLELVDHLAQGIEDSMGRNPKLTFEEALQKEFKKFGIFGFSDVVEQRMNAMRKRYYSILWQYVKACFTLPKVIATASFIYIFYWLFSGVLRAYFFETILISSVPFFCVLLVKSIKYKREQKKASRKWMLKDIIFSRVGMFNFLVLFLQLSNHSLFTSQTNNYVIFCLSVVTVLLFLSCYIMAFVIPAKAEKHLMEQYPEYKFLQKV